MCVSVRTLRGGGGRGGQRGAVIGEGYGDSEFCASHGAMQFKTVQCCPVQWRLSGYEMWIIDEEC